MATTYTSGLRLTNQPTGGNENTWGEIADDNYEFLDDAITAQASVDITGGSDITLIANNGVDDEARKAMLYIHGTPSGANSVIVPASEKAYMIRTAHVSVSGGVTVKTLSGTGVTYNSGAKSILYCDGVSVYEIANVTTEISALDPSNNLSDVADASASRDNLGLGNIAPLNAGSGLTINGTDLEAPAALLIGEVKLWPVSAIPSTWLDCNGAIISRTTYSGLFGVIGEIYGVGDGSTTFVIPDTRGEFIRGWDDGRGVDTGRVLGSNQDEALISHAHEAGSLIASSGGAHSHNITGTDQNANASVVNFIVVDPKGATGDDSVTDSASDHTHTITGSVSVFGGVETRPRNLAMKYIIYTGV